VTGERAARPSTAELRLRLASDLTAGGFVRSPAWQAAVQAVPRHIFLPEFFTMLDGPDGTLWTPVTSQRCADAPWAALTYADDSLVTQLDGHLFPHDVDGPVAGNPTSSATMPRLVTRMWEDLNVEDRSRVLEIGTGSGYSTALGCQRLGDDLLTSIEIDSDVAAKAAHALGAAGYLPSLVVGDGLVGHAAGAPFDRAIATCAVRHIPRPWIDQVRPGGLILTTLSGWLNASALVRVAVTGAGSAEGGFLPGDVSFMMARPHAAPQIGVITDEIRTCGERRTTLISPALLQDKPTARLIAQLAAPGSQHIQPGIDGDPATDYLIDTGSFAALARDAGGEWTVRQGGPGRIWDDIERAIIAWRAAGEPEPHELTVTVTPSSQTVTLDTPTGPVSWTLPE
jgi:methyltransferase of ATP-grasp peptide maturase system